MQEGGEDVEMGNCLQNIGVSPQHTADDTGVSHKTWFITVTNLANQFCKNLFDILIFRVFTFLNSQANF